MSIQNDVSEAEWQARVQLAACFRLLDFYGMSDHTSSHAGVRVPGEPDYFLVNPFGWLFDEITASSLVKIDLDGKILGDGKINPSAYTIHGAVLAVREDVNCSIHTHTRANVAVASMASGLLPLSQHSLQFFERTSYHDYDRHTDEMKRLQIDLGQNWAMMLRNHGVLVAGRTVSEAFQFTQRLEIACQIQVDVGSNSDLTFIKDEVARHSAEKYEQQGNSIGDRSWPAYLRKLDRMDPSYKD
ncbi:MAG: class II aldolase/adducin family protein [Rhodospirillaceae bacterium]|jgi:ribulose-5-phosphate 4-epimerase/fuculose-1-phosphate aldolase|nr:class II aldolase/adducin family protein [Rhodospirillaceae bacterium]